jgi:hypothetical protein
MQAKHTLMLPLKIVKALLGFRVPYWVLHFLVPIRSGRQVARSARLGLLWLVSLMSQLGSAHSQNKQKGWLGSAC